MFTKWSFSIPAKMFGKVLAELVVSDRCLDGHAKSRTITEVQNLELNKFSVG